MSPILTPDIPTTLTVAAVSNRDGTLAVCTGSHPWNPYAAWGQCANAITAELGTHDWTVRYSYLEPGPHPLRSRLVRWLATVTMACDRSVAIAGRQGW